MYIYIYIYIITARWSDLMRAPSFADMMFDYAFLGADEESKQTAAQP